MSEESKRRKINIIWKVEKWSWKCKKKRHNQKYKKNTKKKRKVKAEKGSEKRRKIYLVKEKV